MVADGPPAWAAAVEKFEQLPDHPIGGRTPAEIVDVLLQDLFLGFGDPRERLRDPAAVSDAAFECAGGQNAGSGIWTTSTDKG